MSRKLPPSAAALRSTAVPSPTTYSSAAPSTELPDKMCPVCKRMLYLNPGMTYLINPECYHPMCNSCVANIFGKGPAQCPYASCTKTLRERGFRSAFFQDLVVEREVDVRRRVQAVFNMVQDDFETLKDYNDYLQQVEDLTFDLIQGRETERRAAEEKLMAYEQKHREDIEKNKKRGHDAETLRKQRDAADAEAVRQRRLEEQREEERARAEEATINAEVMEALARGERGTAADIQARIVAQKRARVAEISGSHFPSLLPSSNTTSGANPSAAAPPTSNLLSIRGLRDKTQRDEDADYYLRPYDPFAGLDLQPTRYKLRDEGDGYANPWLEDARKRDDHRVPGYSTREYAARAVFEAFAGLGVVISEEKNDRQRAVGTVGAAEVAGKGKGKGKGPGEAVKMEVDDVFG